MTKSNFPLSVPAEAHDEWLPTSGPRCGRQDGARLIAHRLGVPFSSYALRRSPVPYKFLAGRTVYEISDLEAHARKLLEEAPIRTCSYTGTAS